MGEDGAFTSPDVVLGFDAAWGFAPADQTSPALAGQAGALIDTTMTGERVTELRIHGVSGSDGPTMLEHPKVLQVAGDSVAGFYRRWSPDGAGKPSVPWKLEAYSWGGLTEKPLASASWLLLAPFLMYNVGYFMLPPTMAGSEPAVIREPVPPLRRDRGHQIAHALLRLLAMAATLQFVSAAAAVTMSTVAWQAAGPVHLLLPNWMGWYGAWTAGWRIALAMASVGLVIALLWWISVTTASKYEARTSVAQPELKEAWPLTQPGFWRGQALVGRQRALHVAAAGASVALIAVLPAAHPAAWRWVAIVLAAAVLAAAVVSATLPLADRYTVTTVHEGKLDGDTRRGGRADHWCKGLLIVALATLVFSALVSGWTNRQRGRQTGALPGLTGFLAVLLVAQAVLLISLMVTVMILARRARDADSNAGADRTRRPYLGGNLTTLLAALGFALGGLLSAVISIGVTRLLGTPEPSGFHFSPAPADALAVPWPIFAFGAAPVGLLIGAMAAAIVLFLRYRRNSREFGAGKDNAPSPVAAAYAVSTAGGGGNGDGDKKAYQRNRGAIARAWAIGLIVDDVDVAAALAVGGMLVLVLLAEIAAVAGAGSAGHPSRLYDAWHGAAAVISLIAIAVAAWLVMLLRQAYSDPAKRKAIGALWDVGTFWPRAVHPLAPPCYAERAVPEVVDRVRLLTGHFTHEPADIAYLKYQAELPNLERTRGLTVPPGPLLLTGYSQGSVIAPAVIAQLPHKVLPEVALLTLACPARRLYGRAFPAYFGQRQLTELANLLDAKNPGQEPVPGQSPGRWKNLRRRSDYIGSWIFEEPSPRLSDADLRHNIDQPCQDPVILVQDANPSPPPTQRHSRWWQDPRTSEIGDYLVRLLSGRLGDLPDLPHGQPPHSTAGSRAQPLVMPEARHDPGRDTAGGVGFLAGFRPKTKDARAMIAASSAVILWAAAGTGTAVAGVGTVVIDAAIAAGAAAGVLFAVVAILQLSRPGGTHEVGSRNVADSQHVNHTGTGVWAEVTDVEVRPTTSGRSPIQRDGSDSTGPETVPEEALQPVDTRTVYARLDTPDQVVPREVFELRVGLAPLPSRGVSGPPMSVPAGAFTLTVQLIADGFQLLDEDDRVLGERSLTRTIAVSPDEPYPYDRLRLRAIDDPALAENRTIVGVFTVDGHMVGVAARGVLVGLKAATPAERTTVAPGVDWVLPTDPDVPRPDLEIVVAPGNDATGAELAWFYRSTHKAVGSALVPQRTRLPGNTAEWARAMVRGIEARKDAPDLAEHLLGRAHEVREAIPGEVWAALGAAARISSPPTVLLATWEPFVPWELARVPEPWDADGPPYLGAQTVIGRWTYSEQVRSPAPPARIEARSMAVVWGEYTTSRLPEAEKEGADLASGYEAAQVEALIEPVLDCLKGKPAVDLLHFAVHGKLDFTGTQDGIQMVDKTYLGPPSVRGVEHTSTHMVFLNACQVAGGQRALGEYAGMAAAFIGIEVGAVIAPLWKVDDAVARQVAEQFYRTVLGRERVSPAECLRRERRSTKGLEGSPAGTRLAYLFFGHPLLQVDWGGPHHQPGGDNA